jgi:glucose-6-phosphate 1-dehydrogenase
VAHTIPEPSTFIIFGGTGDLARRKLLPAVARLAEQGLLGTPSLVLSVAKEQMTDEEYRSFVREALVQAKLAEPTVERMVGSGILHYQTIGDATHADFASLSARLQSLEHDHHLPAQNRAYYMALPPSVFPTTIEGLGHVGLNRSDGFTRIVVEKPFGHDLKTAQELNALLHRHFDEKQIYRIDHYLGKDTVQNLLVFRFANAIFESLWNRDRVESVQMTVAEELGVGTRAAYYDRSGAMRDMVQNHMAQLLTLFAMEVPTAYRADAIRYEKLKVLHSIAPLNCKNVVFGQYVAGSIDGTLVPGYLEEPGVNPGSRTETFVGMRVDVDNWRWKGVPFYLRTGKRMPKRTSQIAVRFRDVPISLFQSMGTTLDTPDVLLITLQPHEGFSLHFDIKVPGAGFSLKRIPLAFRYDDMFDDIPEAYETLLLDVLEGDQTLFVHADEVEDSWRVFAPLLENPPELYPYVAGTWGPKEADSLAISERELW